MVLSLLVRTRCGSYFLMVFAIQCILSSMGILPQARNPEAYMNISEIIHYQGYQVEEYEIATSDGYILTLNRIPHGRKQHGSISGKPAVLLQHGLCLEGRIWVANAPNESLGFMLADSGYDVWIGNNRGNSWSRKHQHLTIKQDQYHAYSFDEMARYDIPAMISFILEKPRNSKIHLVGFSQGATQGLIALSSMPHVAEMIKMFHALSPGTTLKNSPNPILKLISLPDATLKRLFGRRDFFLRNEILRKIVIHKCSSIIYDQPYSHFILLIGGYNEKNLNLSHVDVYMSYFPDSTSIQNILHWGQIYKTGQFRTFDYGDGNKEIYNQDEPCSYIMSLITLPIAVWYGEQDTIADPKDIENLLSDIVNLVYHRSWSDWTHWDLIWGLNAPERIFFKIIQLMEKSV
ncbi:lipase member M-like [Erythrolamprus reginae]|uniref:lipase member M-like n=1 Tax=Erythrolamprus reginae TaxID=121349 RepID=UPI00396CA788